MMEFLKFLFCLFSVITANVIVNKPYQSVANIPDNEVRAENYNYRLPNNTIPKFYNVSLVTRVDQNKFDFSGVVRIELLVLENSQKIVLHARQLTVVSMKLTDSFGRDVSISHDYDNVGEFLNILTSESLKAGEKYILEIAYVGELRNDRSGFYRSSYENEEGGKTWLATTQFESTDARHAFPCYDEPAIKAIFEIHITHGPSYTAVSNMPGKTENNSDGTVTTHFDQTPFMSTYLIAFIVSDFKYAENDKAFRHRVFAKPSEINKTAYALDEGEKILNAISSYVKVPFTLPKMDQAAIPDFNAGAMENWGLVTYREEYLLWDESVHLYSRQTSITTIISHEFGHQWFGNLVSPKWWSYIWLNEGFATLFEYLGTDLVHPDWNIFELFVTTGLQSVLRLDASESTRPMTYYVESPNQVSGLFDRIAYTKSGSVIRMFLHAFSQDSFKKGLNYYLERKKYQAAIDTDLYEGLERAVKEDKTLDAKLNVFDIFGSWSNQKGFPLLNITRNYDDGSLLLQQERYTTKYPNPNSDNASWWIPYNFATADKPDFSNTLPNGWLSKNSQSTVVESNKRWTNDDWIIFNKQQTGYYRVLYDEKNYQLITKELNSGDLNNIHSLSRAQILDDMKDFISTGRVKPQTFFNLINYLKRETEYAPWVSAQKAIDDVDMNLAGSEKQKDFHSLVASLVKPAYRKVGLNASDNEAHLTKYLRTIIVDLACNYGVKLCLDETKSEFAKIMRTGKIYSQHNRRLILSHGIRGADVDQIERLWSRFKISTNVDERKEILLSFGHVTNETILNRYLTKSIQPKNQFKFSSTERYNLVTSIAYGSQTGLSTVMSFLTNNIDESQKQFGSVNTLLKNIADRIVTPEMHQKFTKVLQAAENSKISSKKEVDDMHNTVKSKFETNQNLVPQIENSIPAPMPTSGSTVVVSSTFAIGLVMFFQLAI